MVVRDVSNREEITDENDTHFILLRKRRVKQGEGRTNTLRSRHRISYNQVNTETFSIYTFGSLLRRVDSGYRNVLTAVIPPQINYNS
jgi:hypothetical protein